LPYFYFQDDSDYPELLIDSIELSNPLVQDIETELVTAKIDTGAYGSAMPLGIARKMELAVGRPITTYDYNNNPHDEITYWVGLKIDGLLKFKILSFPLTLIEGAYI
jgi:hypothetical protein